MKNKILRLIGTISAFFLSILGLTGCSDRYQALYGVTTDIQQDLYGVPAPTQKYDIDEIENAPQENFEMSTSEIIEPSEDL